MDPRAVATAPGRSIAIRRDLGQFTRYVGASGAALALDVAVFLALLAAAVPSWAASAAGYLGGLGIHWLISSRLVFADRAAPSGPARARQRGLFIMSAFIGLGLTVGIVSLGSAAGLDPRLAKLIAIGVSFVSIYLFRRQVVFAR